MAGDEPSAKNQKVDHKTNFGYELGTQMVGIYIGLSGKHFHVHRKILCSKSDYFKKMFEGRFKEGIDQVATLPEDDADAVALFLQWLYRDSLNPIDVKKHGSLDQDIFLDYIKLYGFVEKICLPDLMDYMMTIVHSALEKHRLPPSRELVTATYAHSTPDSRIRYLMARYIAYAVISNGTWQHIPTERLAETMISIPALTSDVVKVLRKADGKMFKSPNYSPRCDFHVHMSDGECPYKNTIL